MKITARRMGHGLGVSPEQDLAMFREMAARGKRLVGSNPLGQWTFTDDEPRDLVFDVIPVGVDEQFVELCEASGWRKVLVMGGLGIFAAAPGTTPMNTDRGLQREMMQSEARHYLRVAVISLALLVLVGVLMRVGVLAGSLGWLGLLLLLLAIFPFVYSVIPWIGTLVRIRKFDRQGAMS